MVGKTNKLLWRRKAMADNFINASNFPYGLSSGRENIDVAMRADVVMRIHVM